MSGQPKSKPHLAQVIADRAPGIERFREYGRLRQAVIRLSLISHAPTQAWRPAPPPEQLHEPERWRVRASDAVVAHIGAHHVKGGDTQVPRGTDVDRPRRDADLAERAAWWESYHRRIPSYFQGEAVRCERRWLESGDDEACRRRLVELAVECCATIESWKRAPRTEGQEPASRADSNWKRWVAESGEDSGVLARRYGCSRRYVNRIKAMEWSEPEERAS